MEMNMYLLYKRLLREFSKFPNFTTIDFIIRICNKILAWANVKK